MRKKNLRGAITHLLALAAGAIALGSLGASLGEDMRIGPDDARAAPPTPQLIADLPPGAPDPQWRG